MKEIILCKYGEIVLKGANRASFEAMLLRELKFRVGLCGSFKIWRSQSVICIAPLDEFADIDMAFEAASHTFGIISLCRAVECEKTLDAICETAKEYLPKFLADRHAHNLYPFGMLVIGSAFFKADKHLVCQICRQLSG